jgi:membrane-associated phospholipid phosphatase
MNNPDRIDRNPKQPNMADESGLALLPSSSRRKFLGNVGGGAAIALATGAAGLTSLLEAESVAAVAEGNGPEGRQQRINNARQLRFDAARQMASVGIPDQPSNGDEERYPNKIGNYSKGLRHNAIGEVDPAAYAALISAIDSGKFADFEALATNGHLGSGDPTRQRRQVSPMSGYAFDLEGLDSHQFSMRAAPAFSSPEEAGEMVELYWMSMLRDVNFLDYETHPLARLATEDLSRLSDFRGPKQGNRVTPQTLFRDNFPGCAVGPYVSQFLLKNCPFGAQLVDQRIRTAAPGTDFMTDFQSWLDIQNGIQPTQKVQLDEPRFCLNGRDIGQYVHVDALYQAYLVAGLVLLGNGMPWDRNNPYGQSPEPGSGLPLPPGVPGSLAQVGFTTFGGPHLLALLTEVSTRAAKAQWFQKWLVHRRLRPEEFGGRVEVVRSNLAQYPIHSDLFRSQALDQLLSKFGSHLLPMAFPEGSPLHTSYGSGHSTVAGACVTVLKAWFDESAIIPNPVVPNSDGSGLIPYEGPDLTVGGELNKIASNIAQARNIAGVHWRSDATEAIKLGEAVAISVLREQNPTHREPFQGFTLTKLDGTLITIRETD